jgi:hypothetical protein
MDRKARRPSGSASEELLRQAKSEMSGSSGPVETQLEEARRMLREQAAEGASPGSSARVESQLDEARRLLEDQAAEAEARAAEAATRLRDLEQQSPPVPVFGEPEMRRPASAPTRPSRAPSRPQPQPQGTVTAEEQQGTRVLGTLVGVGIAVLGLAVALGLFISSGSDEGSDPTSAPVTSPVVVVSDDIPAVIEAVGATGFYLAPGISDPEGLVADAVDIASVADVSFAAVVFADDRSEGPSAIAGEIEESIAQETVLVLTATEAGISSSVFSSEVLDRALTAGSEAFAEGGDPAYVLAVVGVLVNEP